MAKKKFAGTPLSESAAARSNKFKLTSDDVDGDGEDEADEYEVRGNATTTSPPSSKTVSKAELKRKDRSRSADDMTLLEEEQWAAKKLRVRQRFLRTIVIGVFLDWWGDGEERPSGGKEKKVKKVKKNRSDDGMSFSDLIQKVGEYSGPCMMLAFVFLLFAIRIGGEGYEGGEHEADLVNHYEILGVERNAEAAEIKKTYKKLALAWHPDKNPNCEECEAKFAEISKAYDVLGSADKRKAYDERKSTKASVSSAGSVPLTGQNFEVTVLRSHEVWAVAVLDTSPTEEGGGSSVFSKIWDDVSVSKAHVLRFGHIDKSTREGAAALAFFPHRALVTPAVFRFVRGHDVEEYIPREAYEEDSSKPVIRFLTDAFPAMRMLGTEAELRAWRDVAQPRVLLAGKVAAKGKHAHAISRVSLVSRGLGIEVAVADGKLAAQAFGEGAGKELSTGISVLSLDGHETNQTDVPSLDAAAALLEAAVARLLSVRVPFLTVSNYEQLCKPRGPYATMRVLCLVLMDADEAAVQRALNDLKTSHETYRQDLVDMESADSAGSEEPFHIQIVRLNSRSSRSPDIPPGATAAFHKVWTAMGSTPWFLWEAESRKIAAGRSAGFADIHQKIAYDDIKLADLPEAALLPGSLPDPEESFGHEVRRFFGSSLPCTCVAMLVLAAAAAILPEMEPAVAPLWVAVSLLLLALLWAPLFRRCLSPFYGAPPHW